ncbi:MAG: hypothetical protein R3B47_21695 [Bacteroidia bacterium]
MKKLSLLLSLLTATALLACLQAKPAVATNKQKLETKAQYTQQLTVAQSEKRGSSGVTVIIWP